MKIKQYSSRHSRSLLEQIGEYESRFTSEEYALAVEKDFFEMYSSRDALMQWFMTESPEKLKAIPFLIQHIYEYGYRNILSLGAGESVLEHLLAQVMPETSRVVASDYNP